MVTGYTMRQQLMPAFALVFLMLLTPLSGCFSSNDAGEVSESSLEISPSYWAAGEWNRVEFTAEVDLSVYIPIFMKDPASNFIINGTIIDIEAGNTEAIELLPTARLDNATLFIGEYGQTEFPIKPTNISWKTWLMADGLSGNFNSGFAQKIANIDGGHLPNVIPVAESSSSTSIPVMVPMGRAVDEALSEAEGQAHSEGWVDGREVYEWIEMITDETPDPTDPFDGAVGYLDRWIGNAVPGYEDAINFFSGVLEGYGLRTETQRFQSGTAWAVNICGYKDGLVAPDEWLVFGAHFDIAPPLVMTPGPDIPGYGTRVGAYDNTAGTSMILETAESLSKIDTRRTMVFCLWSSEEEGLWGSQSFTNDVPDGITVTNYVNLDMMGINWPGDWVLSCYIGPEVDPDSIDQKEMYGLAEWIGAGEIGLEVQIERGWAAWSADGESAMWSDQYEDTVAIYESPTARSDHQPFQENLGTITMGWNGVVDGYPCYHRECDKLSTMESYMVTDGRTGEQNLVESFDVVAWWATMTFLALDEKPILNAL